MAQGGLGARSSMHAAFPRVPLLPSEWFVPQCEPSGRLHTASFLGQRAQQEDTYKRLARQTEDCVVRGSKRRGRRTGKPRTTVLTLGQPALPEFPGLSQSHDLRPSSSDGAGKVTGLRGRQIWAQVSVKSWPSRGIIRVPGP